MLSLLKKILDSGEIKISYKEISAKGGLAIFAVFVLLLIWLLR